VNHKIPLELLDDIADLQVIADREDSEPVDLDTVIAELKNAGRI